MPKRKTVTFINSEKIQKKINESGWSNSFFCTSVMGKPRGWISEWLRKSKDGSPAPKNLPSPEEAARMCAILQVTPEEILTEQADIELVKGLIEKEKPAPEGELDEETKELRNIWDTGDKEEREALLAMARMLKARRNK